MSASSVNKRIIRCYAGLTAFCLVFSVVYECFSHDVISMWMVLLSLWPLFGGLLPFLLAARSGEELPAASRALWHCGLLTCLMMAALSGIMQIYGTDFEYRIPMAILGAVLLLSAGVTYVISKKKS